MVGIKLNNCLGSNNMFNFKKKEKMSEEEKNILKRVMMFYEMNKDFFVYYSKPSEKRKIIINICAWNANCIYNCQFYSKSSL